MRRSVNTSRAGGGSVWDAKALDAEVAADTINDQHCPTKVYDYRKDKVPT